MKVYLILLLSLALVGVLASSKEGHKKTPTLKNVAQKHLSKALKKAPKTLPALAEVSAKTAVGTSFVCTREFRYSLTSFFNQQDTQIQFASDQADLCDMCAHVMRRAYIYRNDLRTIDTWDLSLRERACEDMPSLRASDCNLLTAAIIDTQTDYFSSPAVEFTTDELAADTDAISTLLDSKSYAMCLATGCCPAINQDVTVADATQPLPLIPDLQQELASIHEAEAELEHDKSVYDLMNTELEEGRRETNLKETDLLAREKRAQEKQAQQIAQEIMLRDNAVAQATKQVELDAREKLVLEREAVLAAEEAGAAPPATGDAQ